MSAHEEEEDLEMTAGDELQGSQHGPDVEGAGPSVNESGDSGFVGGYNNRSKRYEYRQEKKVQEDAQIDKELQELGLFEEDMTREQKIELLRVLAVSRETAQMEEMIRNSHYSEDQVEHAWDGKQVQNDQEALYQYYEKVKEPAPFGGDRSVPQKTKLSYADAVKETEKKAEVTLESDEDTVPPPSPDNSELPKPSQASESYPAIQADEFANNESLRAISYVSQCKLPGETKYYSLKSQVCESTLAMEVAVPFDFKRKSPSPVLETSRHLSPGMVISERVPFYCPRGEDPSKYVTKILASMDQFQEQLLRAQQNSRTLRQWGDPVVAGRHHPNTIDLFRRGEQPRYWTSLVETQTLSSSSSLCSHPSSSVQELGNVGAEVTVCTESSKGQGSNPTTKGATGAVAEDTSASSPPFHEEAEVLTGVSTMSGAKRDTGTPSPTLFILPDDAIDVVSSTMNCTGTKRRATEEDHPTGNETLLELHNVLPEGLSESSVMFPST